MQLVLEKILEIKFIFAKKEARETTHWLRMLIRCVFKKEGIKKLQREVQELTLIFGKIVSFLKK